MFTSIILLFFSLVYFFSITPKCLRAVNVRASSGREIHRYCGLIKCAECGAILITKRRQWKETEWVEYTCNNHHRYGKEYCTPHRIHESQLYDEVKTLTERIVAESEKYDKIVKDWLRQKPVYEKKNQTVQRKNFNTAKSDWRNYYGAYCGHGTRFNL